MTAPALLLLVLGACEDNSSDAWDPPEGWSPEDVPLPEVLAEDLDEPRGIALVGDAIYVAEYGAGRVVRLEDGTPVEVASGLEGPWMLAADDADPVVSERDGGRVLRLGADGTPEVLAEGLVQPGRILAEGGLVAWVDEGGDGDGTVGWTDGGVAGSAAEPLSGPLGFTLDGQTLLVAERYTQEIVHVALSDGTLETVAGLDGAPQDLQVSDGLIYATAYTYSWPRTSFVFVVDGDEVEELLETPPVPGWIRLSGETLLWACGTGIASGSIEGGDYRVIAVESAVGDLIVADDRAIWTDYQSGEVLSVDLGE